MEELTFEHLNQTLTDYMAAVSELYKQKLNADDKKATGNLIQSVKANVVIDNWNYIGELSLADYWKYVEHGRKAGKFPPTAAILKWIKDKPVIPREVNGITPTNEQLAFLIGRKIAEDGIEAGNQLANTIEELNAIWLPKIEEALEQDINEGLARIIVL